MLEKIKNRWIRALLAWTIVLPLLAMSLLAIFFLALGEALYRAAIEFGTAFKLANRIVIHDRRFWIGFRDILMARKDQGQFTHINRTPE